MKQLNPIPTPELLEVINKLDSRLSDWSETGAIQKCQILDLMDKVGGRALTKANGALRYGWNDPKEFPAPSGKLQFYTIGGTCLYGESHEFAPGFITHWAYLLPSPTKQAGEIK